MSASCRRAETPAGFTLLELLIVLAIIAGASALVAPRLQSTYDAIVSSGERAEVKRALERLPLRARDAGHDLRFPAGSDGAIALATHLVLPAGWHVEPMEPVVVYASGLCESARLGVQRGDARETWRLSAPMCAVDDVPQD